MEMYIFYFFAACNTALMGLNLYQQSLISKYQKLLKDYQHEFARNDIQTLLIYCLKQIHATAVKNEDFETAARCRDLLKEYEDGTKH